MKLSVLAGLVVLQLCAEASAAEIFGTITWTYDPAGLENVLVVCMPWSFSGPETQVLASRPDWTYTCDDLREGEVYKVFAGGYPIVTFRPCPPVGFCGEFFHAAGDGIPVDFIAYPLVRRVDLTSSGDLGSLTLTARFYRLDRVPIAPTGTMEFWEYLGDPDREPFFRILLSSVSVENQQSVDSDVLALEPGRHVIRGSYRSVDDFVRWESNVVVLGDDTE